MRGFHDLLKWKTSSNIFDMLGQHPANVVECGPQIEQKRDQVRIIMRQSNLHRRVEGPMNLPDAVAILPECDFEKLQLIMQVVLVAQSSRPMHRGGKCSIIVG
jgi:hypothetical protein